jgi:CRISPR system Cascade subunit CasC
MPTGMLNSYANNVTPYSVYVTLREDTPVNFSGAFEKAIKASDEGFEGKSAEKLAEYAGKSYNSFVKKPVKAFVVGDCLGSLAAETVSVDGLVDTLGKVVLDELTAG